MSKPEQIMMRRAVAGRYELVAPIGRGGMGEVWSAYDIALDRRLAVKLLRPDVLPSGTAGRALIARFQREARLTARLEHPGVPSVFDAGVDDGDFYLAMQLLDGSDLGDLLAERGALPIEWAVAVAGQVASVLAAAHTVSLVHRDLKPRNIMVGEAGTVRVLDFGVAALLDAELTKITTEGETLGSPAYMAPEQVLRGTASPRSDLYSLGCVLHEMLCGQPLFFGESSLAVMYQHLEQPPEPARVLRPDLPEPLERLLLDLLAKKPELRPNSAQDVYARLDPYLPRPGAATAEEPMDPTRPYRRPCAPKPADKGRANGSPGLAAFGDAGQALDIAELRRRAAELVDSGRLTQAASVLAGALDNASAHDQRDLRLEYASVLMLGGEYHSALPEYQRLVGEFSTVDSELATHCREQAAVCRVELGDGTDALKDFRALLAERQRNVVPDDPELFEMRRQIGLLEASTGEAAAAHRTLRELLADSEHALGPQHPETLEVAEILRRLERARW